MPRFLWLVLVIWGCDDGADFDMGSPPNDGGFGDGEVDSAIDADGGLDAAVDGALDAMLDGAQPDADVTDMGPPDLCEGVACAPGELCDPTDGACSVVEEPPVGGAASGCAQDADCESGTCNLDAPGGFCQSACDADGRCETLGLRCASIGDDGAQAPVQVCLDECEATACRENWVCVPDDNGAICLPSCVEAGCNGRSFCDGETGICEPFEGDFQALGARCNARDDMCGPGLVCLPDDDTGNGACHAVCEARDAPCPDGQFCATLMDVADGEPAIGVCLPGDGCDPLAPEVVCGPDSACVAAPPVTLCVGTGPQAENAPCEGGRLCQAGLICQYGTCTRPCGERQACANGERCVDYSDRVGQPFGFCHGDCDPLDGGGCNRGEHCILADVESDGTPVGRCEAGMPGALAQDDACQPNDTYYGDCEPNHLCDAQAPEDPQCRQLCEFDAAGVCPNAVCARGVFDEPFSEIGICLGGCSVIGANSNCPGGAAPRTCVFTGLLGNGARGQEMLVGECLPSLGFPQATTGERCLVDDDLGTHNCVNGHICAVVARGQPAECVELCDVDVVGRPPCTPGLECVVDIFGGSDRWGACLPQP